MNMHQEYSYINACMLTNVFLCGIMSFNKKQSEELKTIFELIIIRKMWLGDNFPRKLLCVKKSALGVGLIEPKMVIDSLALELCSGNNRSKGELKRVSNMHEEISAEDSGLPKKVRRNECEINYCR